MSLYLPIRKTKYKELKDGDDLNKYGTTPGVWFSLNGNITSTLLNRPAKATGGAILITMDITGGEWTLQLFITNGAQMFFRAHNGEWKMIKFE
ncbi:pyocin knob domain-containing protein [Blautia sp.]|uniref:pyocin knob domain-containing protein n=1 Tax=Blautia sp. TaxID=1955243 RepID=UPI002E7A0D34|nr:pyocin knob domain-containing protein [Blautia sp.]MEE0642908.1 pyocin knob domain-containing protein [Blautia sp.]